MVVRSGVQVLRQIKRSVVRGTRSTSQAISRSAERAKISLYLRSERRPWSTGYWAYRLRYLGEALRDPAILNLFRTAAPLPKGYGFRLDARMIEIPWVLSQLPSQPMRVLDAGSSLNHLEVVTAPALQGKSLTILTLGPEANNFWQMAISYVYDDLRAVPFRDEYFDTVCCISTIEHVGMDNAIYAQEFDRAKPGNQTDFLIAVRELKRVLKPGGTLFITFPFGKYENHGWFQQFDAAMLDILVNTFQPTSSTEAIFRYLPDGWAISNRQDCAACEFFDVQKSKYFDPASTIEYPKDFPAGERAVACLKLVK